MRLSIAILALCLAACTGGGNCARLPGGGQYCLVDGPWPEFTAEQATTLRYRDKPLSLITRIESGKEGLRFAGITPLGQTLIEVSWENGVLRSELSPALADRLEAAFFPALLQLATWPAEKVREGLSERLTLTEKNGQRVVSDGRQDILIVSWEGKTLPYERLRFEAPAAGLLIEVRTLAESDEP